MPNPKKKHSQSRRDSRRAQNWKIKAQSLSKCSHCGAATQPHHVCPACGFYDGELIMPKKAKAKKEQKAEEKKPEEGTK